MKEAEGEAEREEQRTADGERAEERKQPQPGDEGSRMCRLKRGLLASLTAGWPLSSQVYVFLSSHMLFNYLAAALLALGYTLGI